MRGFAACWVLVHHANQSVTTAAAPLGTGIQAIANGYLGVDFFFVLSGFIIALSSNKLLERGGGIREYLSARAIRIYVPYLPIGIAMLVLYALFPGISGSDRTPGLVTSITLFPTSRPPALSVAWTLVHELLFYAVFSLIFVSRKLLWLAIGAWCTVIGAQYVFGQNLVREGWGYMLSPINLCFFLGVGTFYAIRGEVSAGISISAAIFGLIIVGWEGSSLTPKGWLISLGFAALIVGSTGDLINRFKPGRFLVFLGAASYSIYLVHSPMLSASIRVVQHITTLAVPAAFALLCLMALAASFTYYFVYEIHALAAVRALKVRAFRKDEKVRDSVPEFMLDARTSFPKMDHPRE